jgi:hypothetical protein
VNTLIDKTKKKCRSLRNEGGIRTFFQAPAAGELAWSSSMDERQLPLKNIRYKPPGIYLGVI